jgi:phage terminase Nu1 subunit (DNA packaging protein)
VDKWLRERDSKRDERASLKDQKTQAEIDRIQRDISKRDLELAQQRGEVHGREECCKSLTSVVSEVLQPLLSVGSRLAAQFPELGQRLRDACDKEIDAAMAQIRGGLEK